MKEDSDLTPNSTVSKMLGAPKLSYSSLRQGTTPKVKSPARAQTVPDMHKAFPLSSYPQQMPVSNAYEPLLRNQRTQILELIEKGDNEHKKWLELNEELTAVKAQSETRLLELESALAMSKMELEERNKRTSNAYSNIMSDQIRLKGLLLDLSGKYSNLSTNSVTSSPSATLPSNASYYEKTKLTNEIQDQSKILQQINQSYQKLERNLYELFRIPSDTSTILTRETLDIFQTINQQANIMQSLKKKESSTLSMSKQENHELNNTILKQKNAMEELSIIKDALQTQVFSYQQQMASLQEESRLCKEKLKEYENKTTTINSSLTYLEQKLHSDNSAHLQELMKKESLLMTLQNEKNHFVQEIKQLKDKNQQILESKVALELEISHLNDRVLSSTVNSSEKDKEKKDLIAHYEKEIELKNSYNMQLQALIKKLKDDKGQESNKFNQLNNLLMSEKQSLFDEKNSLSDLNNSLKLQLQSLTEKMNELQSQHSALLLKNETLQKHSDSQILFWQNSVLLLENQLKEKNLLLKEQEEKSFVDVSEFQVVQDNYNNLTNLYQQLMKNHELLKKEASESRTQMKNCALQLSNGLNSYHLKNETFFKDKLLLPIIANVTKLNKIKEKMYSFLIIQKNQIEILQSENLLKELKIQEFFKEREKLTLSNQLMHEITLKETQDEMSKKEKLFEGERKEMEKKFQLKEQAFQDKIAEYKMQMKTLQESINFSNETIQSLQSKSDSQDLTINLMNENILSLQFTIDELNSSKLLWSNQEMLYLEKVKVLNHQLQEMKMKHEFLEATHQEEKKNLEIEAKETKQYIQQFAEEIDQLQSEKRNEMKLLQDDSLLHLSKLQEKQQENDKLIQKLHENEKMQTEFLDKQESLQRSIQSQQKEIQLLNEKLTQAAEKNNRKNYYIYELNAKNIKLKEKLSHYKMAFSDQENELNAKIGQFSNDMLSIQLQLNDLNTTVSDSEKLPGLPKEEEGLLSPEASFDVLITPLKGMNPGKLNLIGDRQLVQEKSNFGEGRIQSPAFSTPRRIIEKSVLVRKEEPSVDQAAAFSGTLTKSESEKANLGSQSSSKTLLDIVSDALER
jgi:hypothetical protein